MIEIEHQSVVRKLVIRVNDFRHVCFSFSLLLPDGDYQEYNFVATVNDVIALLKANPIEEKP